MAEYVKRDDALRALEQINPVDYGAMWDYEAHHYAGECLRDCKEAIGSIPAADVAPVVHGRWVVRFDGPYKRRRCYCSHCGKHNGIGGIAKNQEKPYCPNCGAMMDGGVGDAKSV